MRKIAIVGSRNYPKLFLVEEFIQQLPLDCIIVSGGAAGVDITAEKVAQKRNLSVEIYYPDWSLGKRAGFLRNKTIVDSSDEVWAWWDEVSRGTKSSIDLAIKAGKLKGVYGLKGELITLTEEKQGSLF